MTAWWTTMPSPVDELLLVTDGDALTGLWFSPHEHRWAAAPDWRRDDAHPLLTSARTQLEAYFARDLKAFDVPLAPVGTPFQHTVWAALREIPYGETTSYGEIARRIGRPSASRAVGLANGRNPISIVVPCHRVIGSAGALTGYGGGMDRKRTLLDLESAVLF
jgi:methylated-DNA-[protein]-cysteine S-methyltransferase